MTTAPQIIETDVLIVVPGPTEPDGAHYAGFRGLTTAVADVLPQVSRQVMALYPEKQNRDGAALPRIRGRDFIVRLPEQADAFNPKYPLGKQAASQETPDAGTVVNLEDGTVVRAGAVVLIADIRTPKPPPLGTGAEWLDTALSYFVADQEVHRDQDDQDIVVVGGDSALDWADALAPIARSITLVHRRAHFRGHAATLGRVHANEDTKIVTDTEVASPDGELAARRLEKVTLRRKDGQERVVAAGHVAAALGFISDIGPLHTWGLGLRGRSVKVDGAIPTNLPHVYAAGDVAGYDGKVKLMSVGFGEVALAMNHVAVDLDPDLTFFPVHSTDESCDPKRAQRNCDVDTPMVAQQAAL